MGIKQLMKLLSEDAAGCFKETEKANYMGRTVAIDASMQLYQFLIQVRTSQNGGIMQNLANDAGEVTSHIMGFFYRTINLLQQGIKPVFVFDGKPPELKIQELKKRKESKEKAEKAREDAEKRLEEGDKEAVDEINKANKRSTRVTKEHNEDVQKLLQLMGLPVVLSPGEAEAQCSELCKKGKVYAVGTEDMDALTFGAPILLRKLTQATTLKQPVVEIHLEKVLGLLEISMDQFVDLCILCGCDYCPRIGGIGPKTALKLIRDHKTIEKVVESLEGSKTVIPESFMELLNPIREIFRNPEVQDGDSVDIKFAPVDEEGIVQYLVHEKGFNEQRVRASLTKLSQTKSQTSQKRLDSFFKPKANDGEEKKVVGFKRKTDGKDQKKGVGAKRGRGGKRR